jgi:PAS domain S-box-containing protein
MVISRDPLDVDLFQMAVDLAPAGMLAVDEDGHIILVNHEVLRIFGYARDELLGQHVDMLVPQRLRDSHPGHRRHYLKEAMARPMGSGRDLYGVRQDGTEVLIEIGLNPMIRDGKALVLASVVDLSTRRHAEDQLRQAQKMEAIGTLASGIAHDFNNVLFNIIGYTELVQAKLTDAPEQYGDLDRVLQAAERGRQLVQRILSFSRRRDIARSPLRMDKTLGEILHLLRATLPTTIEIRANLSASVPVVLSDETHLHQVVMNLATNAAHAMPEGGVLDISVGPVTAGTDALSSSTALPPGLYAHLSVSDSGVGMPPEVRERAAEPFFTTRQTSEGTGLGLSIIHGIVESHHGTMQIHSELGKGTRVDIYLPAHVGALADAAATADEDEEQGFHVLLVDDEPDIATMLARQMGSLGYRVTAHTSSLEALEAFNAQPQRFDLLVTDNTMPKLTGLALTKAVLRKRPGLPVLLISGLAETIDPQELAALGVTRVLPKPHNAKTLAAVLAQLLPGSHGH